LLVIIFCSESAVATFVFCHWSSPVLVDLFYDKVKNTLFPARVFIIIINQLTQTGKLNLKKEKKIVLINEDLGL
jgi:hypothetical protein